MSVTSAEYVPFRPHLCPICRLHEAKSQQCSGFATPSPFRPILASFRGESLELCSQFIPVRDIPVFVGKTVEDAANAASGSSGTGKGVVVLRDAKHYDLLVTSRESVETPEEALNEAKNGIPEGAVDVDIRVCRDTETGTLDIEAFSEHEALLTYTHGSAEPEGALLASQWCVSQPQKGFIGFGKRPGVWRFRWRVPFRVSVKYLLPAKVIASR